MPFRWSARGPSPPPQYPHPLSLPPCTPPTPPRIMRSPSSLRWLKTCTNTLSSRTSLNVHVSTGKCRWRSVFGKGTQILALRVCNMLTVSTISRLRLQTIHRLPVCMGQRPPAPPYTPPSPSPLYPTPPPHPHVAAPCGGGTVNSCGLSFHCVTLTFATSTLQTMPALCRRDTPVMSLRVPLLLAAV